MVLPLISTGDRPPPSSWSNHMSDKMQNSRPAKGNPANEPAMINPKEHGHATLAGLFAEMQADEATGKREEAHMVRMGDMRQLLGGTTEEPDKTHDRDRGMEM